MQGVFTQSAEKTYCNRQERVPLQEIRAKMAGCHARRGEALQKGYFTAKDSEEVKRATNNGGKYIVPPSLLPAKEVCA